MKKIITLLTIVTLFLLAGNLLAQTNTWDGSTSVSWTVGTNWSLGHVPTSTEDVVIPSTPVNQPTLSGAAGVCQNLTVNSGATLTISATTLTNGTLTASGNATMNGALSIGGALTKTGKLVAVNITWGATSSVSGYINSAIELSGDWEFSTGSSISMGYCGVTFTGAANTAIISKSSNSSFSGVSISKASGNTVTVSSLSTSTLKFNGILTINSGSTLLGGANITTIFYSNINNSGHFSFSSGTVSFEKSSGTQAVQVNSGDFFNNLVINSGGTVTINNFLQILNDVTISAGTFDPLGNTIVLFGDWSNTVGTAGFTEGTSRVIFSGGNYHQYSSTETFNVLEVHKAIGGAFRANGTNVTCAQYDWTAGSVDVLNNGTFTANDLADDGIFGGYYVNTGCTINLYQDGLQFVDLNGDLVFTGGGTINVYGGSAISVWAFADDASVTMNGGTLDFKNQGIKLVTAVAYSLTTAITGGTIRTAGDYYSNRAGFSPAGGTIELYGGTGKSIEVTAGAMRNLLINKNTGVSVTLASNLTVNGTFTADNGSFINSDKIVTLGGNLNINDNGIFHLGPGSQLKMATDMSILVNSGGKLETYGNGADGAVITHSAGYYYLDVQPGGTISSKYTTFMYSYRLLIGMNGIIDPANAFYHCTFTNFSTSSFLSIQNTQTLSLHEVNFPSLPPVNNVSKGANSGYLYFKDATGAYAGAAYEYDPYNRIFWSASVPGRWTGEISSDWYTPQNWDDYAVPTAATNVTIASGATYYPITNTEDVFCNNLSIESGAQMTLTDGSLIVAGDLTIHGHLSMTNDSPQVTVEGSVFWENGSTANVTSGAFHVKTDWEFRNGSAAVISSGVVYFEGTGTAYIRSFEANSAFWHLYNNKEPGSLYVSNTSTDTLKVNGRICVPSYGSSFYANSTLPIVVKENLWATGYVYCLQGTLIFNGASSIIQLISGGYLNNVIINTIGNVTLNDSIVVNGNLTIQSGALNPGDRPVRVKGNWTNNVGSTGFLEGTCRVTFEGAASSDILTDETFYNLNIEKTYTGFDGVEFGDSISVKGDLLVKTGTLEMNYGGRLHIGNTIQIAAGAGLNANDSNVKIYSEEDWIDNNLTATTTTGFNAGTSSVVHFLGKPANIQTIYEKCTFNDVVVAGTGTYSRPDTDDMLCRNLTISSGTFRVFTHTVRISENLTIGTGTLRMDLGLDFMDIGGSVTWLPGSNDLITVGTFRVGANWTFQNGTNASLGAGNTVIFDKAGVSTIRNDDSNASFGVLEISKPAGPDADTYLDASTADTVRVAGSMLVSAGNQFHLSNKQLLVQGNLDIMSTGEMDMTFGALVNRHSAFLLNGKLNAGSGNVLIKGSFEEAMTGVLEIGAAVFTVDAPASATYNKIRGVFNLNSGTFNAVRTGIEIASTASTSIIGGTIMTGYGFAAVTSNTFKPSGGTVKFASTDPNYTVINCTGGNYFNDVEINGLCVIVSDLTIKDDVLINISGTLDTDSFNLIVEGDWTNLDWPYGFESHNNLVTFAGPNDADILTSENFYNLVVMKTNTNTTALEITSDRTIDIANDFTISDGCLELNARTNLLISNDLHIASGAGLNADDTDVNIMIGGDWTNQNVSVTGPAVSFHPGTSSHVSFILDNNSYLTTNRPQEEFFNLSILKPGYSFMSNDNIQCDGNLLIDGGNWEDNVPGLHHIVGGNFTVNTNGAIMNALAQNTFEFMGGPANLSYHSTTGCLHDVIINKLSYYYMNLNTNLNCLYNGNLTIQSGTFYGNGYRLWVEGDIAINNGAELNFSTPGELVLSNLNAINVNSGGTFILVGGTIRADVTTARYAFNVNSGGTIYAAGTIFKHTGPNGVYLNEGSIVNSELNFLGCTFQDGAAGGTLLRIDNNQDLTIRYVNFPANTWGGASNVTKSVNAGHVYFVDFTGAYAGEANDNDPFGLVTWVPALTSSASASPSTICEGSSTQLNTGLSGGLAPYMYTWTPATGLSDPNAASPIATPAVTTTYNLSIYDNLGSYTSSSVTVTVQPVLPVSVSVAPSSNPSPPGSYVLFTATPVNGGASPAYQWKVNGMNAGTGLSTYSYVPANGDDVACVMTSNYACASGNPATSNTIAMIVMPANVAVNGTVSAPLSLCFDASNTITVAGGGNTFLVETGASAIMIAGVKISYLYGTTVLPGGFMHGYITTTHAYCGGKMPSLVNVVAGDETEVPLEPEPVAHRYTIYPNPTAGPFTVMAREGFSVGTTAIEIFDLRGNRVFSDQYASEQSHLIQPGPLNAGFYLVKLLTEGKVQSFKLIVTQ